MTPAAGSGGATPASSPLRVLVEDPLVVMAVTEGRRAPIGPLPALTAALGRRPAQFLLQLHGQFESADRSAALVRAWRDHMAVAPHQPITVLANTMREVRALLGAGVAAVLCNHNAFIDEETFVVDPPARKEFDAIYVARFAPEKRHELAARVPRLALVSGHLAPAEHLQLDHIRRALPGATWANAAAAAAVGAALAPDRAGNVARRVIARLGHVGLGSAAVVEWMNRSSVGLCLSASEGAMRASMEYLLCGLPVVSTRNIGGRDRYRHPGHWLEVPADPAAVAAGVARLVAAPPDPRGIRAAALAKIGHDRAAFVDLVQSMVEDAGGTSDFAARLPGLLRGGILRRASVAEFARGLARP